MLMLIGGNACIPEEEELRKGLLQVWEEEGGALKSIPNRSSVYDVFILLCSHWLAATKREEPDVLTRTSAKPKEVFIHLVYLS